MAYAESDGVIASFGFAISTCGLTNVALDERSEIVARSARVLTGLPVGTCPILSAMVASGSASTRQSAARPRNRRQSELRPNGRWGDARPPDSAA
jgi:hypothetical protein